MKVQYQRYEVIPSPTTPEGVLYRPEIPIRVIGSTGEASFLALADTGSDETLLPRSIGEAIGASIDQTKAWFVSGFGGQEVEVVLGELAFELISPRKVYRWRGKAGFVSFLKAEDEVAILGHVSFFDHFTARFNTRQRQVTILPYR